MALVKLFASLFAQGLGLAGSRDLSSGNLDACRVLHGCTAVCLGFFWSSMELLTLTGGSETACSVDGYPTCDWNSWIVNVKRASI